MKRTVLLLSLLLFGLLSACADDPAAQRLEPSPAATPVENVLPSVDAQQVEPPSTADPTENTSSSVIVDVPASPTAESPIIHHEGDVDSAIMEQIGALEQNSSVRNDDVAPIEASAYCKFSVSCEALLEHKAELTDIPLPPDGILYSGTIVLHGEENALTLVNDTLNACNLIFELAGNDIIQIAAIPNDLHPDMRWVVRCNGGILDDPANAVITSGDILVVSYEVK